MISHLCFLLTDVSLSELPGRKRGTLRPMKPIVWVRHVKISTNGDDQSPLREHPSAVQFSAADKAAFLVLALGLLALGGVLFAAGIAVLLALVAAGAAIGGATAVRHWLFGKSNSGLRPGEITASGEVLPGGVVLPPSSLPPGSTLTHPGERPPRGD